MFTTFFRKQANQATTNTTKQVANILAPKASAAYVDVHVAVKANKPKACTKSEVDGIAPTKQPTITSSTNLTLKKT